MSEKEHNYMQDMLDIGLELAKKPGVYMMTIEHDDDCPKLLTDGTCNCNPTIASEELK